MKFPWKNLYTAPVELTLKDLHLVTRLSQTVPYNQEEEERQEFANKMKRVEEMEDSWRLTQLRSQSQAQQATSDPNQPSTSSTG